MRTRLSALVVLAAALTWTACGNDEGPTGSGRVQDVVFDPETSTFTGELTGQVQVSISPDGSTWLDLGSLNGVTIGLQSDSDSTSVHGEQTAPADQYTRVRLIFQGVTAELPAGTTVGTTTLTADESIDIGGSDQRVEIVKQVSGFQVLADTTVRRTILFDLRSALWITEVSLAAGVVEDAVIQGAVVASTISEPRT